MITEHSTSNDIGRCSRCGQFFVAEEFNSHICSIPFKGVKELLVDYYFEGMDENENKVIIAKGLNGIIYRLVQQHNSPRILLKNASDERKHYKDSDGDVTEPCFFLLIS